MDTEPTYVMVLGSMQPKQVDATALESADQFALQARTLQLVRLLRSIWHQISADSPAAFADVIVEGPDEGAANQIVHGILVKIERADLVIADLTGNSPNVAYELGLVHSLGLPYILLTSDTKPIFYFRMSLCINRFDLADSYNSQRQGHQALHDRVRDFLSSKTSEDFKELFDNFVRSHPTDFFKLPIIDISAASGLAAGYWNATVRCFARPAGFFSLPRRITWEQLPGKQIVEENGMVDRLVAIHPPSDLLNEFSDDLATLKAALVKLDLCLIPGTIYGDPEDKEDVRSYGAGFLGQVNPDGSTIIRRPLIVVEIPTTLYALRFAPRIVRIYDEQRSGRSRTALRQQRRRRLSAMIERFGLVLEILIDESGLSKADRFNLIRVDNLAAELRHT